MNSIRHEQAGQSILTKPDPEPPAVAAFRRWLQAQADSRWAEAEQARKALLALGIVIAPRARGRG